LTSGARLTQTGRSQYCITCLVSTAQLQYCMMWLVRCKASKQSKVCQQRRGCDTGSNHHSRLQLTCCAAGRTSWRFVAGLSSSSSSLSSILWRAAAACRLLLRRVLATSGSAGRPELCILVWPLRRRILASGLSPAQT